MSPPPLVSVCMLLLLGMSLSNWLVDPVSAMLGYEEFTYKPSSTTTYGPKRPYQRPQLILPKESFTQSTPTEIPDIRSPVTVDPEFDVPSTTTSPPTCPYYICPIDSNKPRSTIKEYVDYKIKTDRDAGNTTIWTFLILHIIITFTVLIPGLVYLFLYREPSPLGPGAANRSPGSPDQQQQQPFNTPSAVKVQTIAASNPQESTNDSKGFTPASNRLLKFNNRNFDGQGSPKLTGALKEYIAINNRSGANSPSHMSNVFAPGVESSITPSTVLANKR